MSNPPKRESVRQNPRAKTAAPASAGVPGVFVDRDGTLNEEVGYMNHLSRLRLFPWSGRAIRKLNGAGVPVIAVTNQSGIARGYFTDELLHRVHEEISRQLAAQNARIDAFYYCPHHPEAPLPAYRLACRCRKPATGMVEEGARRFHLDLANAYVVGDTYRDMQLGFNAGLHTILVMTGYGRGEFEYHARQWPRQPERVVENLLEASTLILEDLQACSSLAGAAFVEPNP
jgi:D-glycero-D-manno-heptose 1,7-bisphosphate phosphatase